MLTALIAKVTLPMAGMVAWQIFEWWLGRTKTVKSTSTLSLIYNIGRFLMGKK